MRNNCITKILHIERCKEYLFKSDRIHHHIKVYTHRCISVCSQGSNIVLLNSRGERNVKPGSRHRLCALLSPTPISISIAPPWEFCVSEDGSLYKYIVSRIVQTEFVFGSVGLGNRFCPLSPTSLPHLSLSGEMSRLNHNYWIIRIELIANEVVQCAVCPM